MPYISFSIHFLNIHMYTNVFDYIVYTVKGHGTVCEPQNTVTGLEYISSHSSSKYVISLASAPFDWLYISSVWMADILAEKYK